MTASKTAGVQPAASKVLLRLKLGETRRQLRIGRIEKHSLLTESTLIVGA